MESRERWQDWAALARVHLHAAALQVAPNFLEEPRSKAIALKQMPELAHRRLIGRRLGREIDSGKCAHRSRFVERLFHRRVRQIEPVSPVC